MLVKGKQMPNIGPQKKTVKKAFEATIQLRNEMRKEYLKLVHSRKKDSYVERAESMMLAGKSFCIDGMSAEEFGLLCDLEEMNGLICRLSSHL